LIEMLIGLAELMGFEVDLGGGDGDDWVCSAGRSSNQAGGPGIPARSL
jgi:hypothetical protein